MLAAFNFAQLALNLDAPSVCVLAMFCAAFVKAEIIGSIIDFTNSPESSSDNCCVLFMSVFIRVFPTRSIIDFIAGSILSPKTDLTAV